MKRLALAIGFLTVALAASTPARADYAVIQSAMAAAKFGRIAAAIPPAPAGPNSRSAFRTTQPHKTQLMARLLKVPADSRRPT